MRSNSLRPALRVTAGAVLVTLALASSACSKRRASHRVDFDLGRREGGVSAGRFQSLNDYFNHPTVSLLIDNMPIHDGSLPPDVNGTYDAFGGIADTTIPGSEIGDAVTAAFCFGVRVGNDIVARVLDPTAESAGAASFITGTGNLFTVYTAFRSVQSAPGGGVCEIHQVNVFSGRRAADGSLDELEIGLAIVGLIGDCDPLLIGDAQISRLAALRVGEACSDAGPQPGDLTKVQVILENFLLNPVLFFDDPSANAMAIANVEPLDSVALELDPGFELDFESLPPLAGQDDQGMDLVSGEILAGLFPRDVTPAGGSVTYFVESIIGDEEFFAPRPFNDTGEDMFSVVNSGVAIPGYPDPPGSGLDCFCSMPPSQPSDGPYDIGYYVYSSPGIITPAQANVRFFAVSDGAELVPPFRGDRLPEPEGGTGAVLLEVGAPAP